jgi:hypothetical protein
VLTRSSFTLSPLNYAGAAHPRHSGNAAISRDRGLDATPLGLGTSPFSWTCGRGRFGRPGGGRECSAPPRTTQNACLPLSSRMPHFPPSPLNHAGAAHTRHSGNAAHAERGPTCMCVRRAPSRARPCGRVWRHRGARARDACVSPSIRVTEPTPPRRATPMSGSRLMPPGHRTACGAHTPEREWGVLVFRAARSSAGLRAGDLSVLAEGRWVDDGR